MWALVDFGSKFQELQASKFSFPASGGELPSGGDTDAVVTVVIPVVADIEAVLVEAAEVDAVAVRVHRGSPSVYTLGEPDATHLVVGGDEPAQLSRI